MLSGAAARTGNLYKKAEKNIRKRRVLGACKNNHIIKAGKLKIIIRIYVIVEQ